MEVNLAFLDGPPENVEDLDKFRGVGEVERYCDTGTGLIFTDHFDPLVVLRIVKVD